MLQRDSPPCLASETGPGRRAGAATVGPLLTSLSRSQGTHRSVSPAKPAQAAERPPLLDKVLQAGVGVADEAHRRSVAKPAGQISGG